MRTTDREYEDIKIKDHPDRCLRNHSTGRISSSRTTLLSMSSLESLSQSAHRQRTRLSIDCQTPNPTGSQVDLESHLSSKIKSSRPETFTRVWSNHKMFYSNLMRTFVMILTFSTLIDRGNSIEWLAVAKNQAIYWNQTKDCRSNDGKVLTRHQQKLCLSNLDLMYAVVHASLQTAQICQELFMDNRWNCSNILRAPNFWPDLTEGTREQAFVYALASASLTQAVAKTCSSGYSKKCSCYRETGRDISPSDFKWGGCGDDVRFASSFAQTFTDQIWQKNKDKSKKSIVNLHNNKLGRKMMEDSLGKVCKCHGVSGSCSVKTCWKALPELKTVGIEMMTKYSDAVKVTLKKVPVEDQKRFTRSARHQVPEVLTLENSVVDYGGEEPWKEIEQIPEIQEETPKQKPVAFKRILVHAENRRQSFSDQDLLFVTLSPDYCSEDVYVGSPGTVGRECFKNETHAGGCKSMCCGRGYVTERVPVQYRCDCKYYWCCYVKCKVCTKIVEQNRCK